MRMKTMAKSRKSKVPPLGTLVRLKSHTDVIRSVKVEMTDIPDGGDDDCTATFDTGTLALVVGSIMNPLHEEPVPIILVNNFMGWVYNDEWEQVVEEN
jgi:hypothetical protein